MSPRTLLKISAVTLVTFAVGFGYPTGLAQQPGPAVVSLPDTPQILSSATGQFRVVPIKGLVYPWALTFLPNGDMLVTEQNQTTLRLIRNGVLDPTPIRGLPPVTTSQRRDTAGIDITAHPDFSANQLVYVAYWKPKPGDEELQTATIVRARLDGYELVEVEEIFESVSWTDGPSSIRLIFGPDGTLYFTIGAPIVTRSGESMWAQAPEQHGGKILRINEDGTVPQDNPFVGRPNYQPEIFALGIRNAIGMAFHPQTGELWETENGPQGGDELNLLQPGVNYGWPVVGYGVNYGSGSAIHGGTRGEDMENPRHFWVPSIATASLLIYTGDQFPAWKGDFFVGGLAGQQLARVTPSIDRAGRIEREETLTHGLGRIRDVRQGPDGYIYLALESRGAPGRIVRLEPVNGR